VLQQPFSVTDIPSRNTVCNYGKGLSGATGFNGYISKISPAQFQRPYLIYV